MVEYLKKEFNLSGHLMAMAVVGTVIDRVEPYTLHELGILWIRIILDAYQQRC